ncbi:CBL-interacting protein kinase 18-like [Phalaenopsis equestris]|uniref:CBL-interacting protein kinase 18-like n=1 Tax=Phalaenopsis equestris TaxID=78828 RepID=UPI0009E60A71|nr:CBL-interacting protein kinase 18-like [Phalaenopsis equestris]
MENKEFVLMKKYEIGRMLGKGTFAKVYYARNINTAQTVAIKMIDKEKVLKIGLMDQIKREISVMRLMNHPNIVDLYEVMATKNKIYFVMECMKGGELFNKVAKGKLKEDVARKFFQQLITAVEFCHSRGVYHRDLKLENLLLDENGNLKVSDFGFSTLIDSKRQDLLLHTTCGTPAYVAPEVISRKGYDGAKADIWSCGVILYVLLAGYLPFRDANLMVMYRKIGKAEFKCPHWFPPEVRRLLSKILDPNPTRRISIEKIMDHPWFQKAFDGKQKEIVTEKEEDITHIDVNNSLIANNNNVQEEEKKDEMKIRNMNAFDIISLSNGFDLSGLFVDADHRNQARFTSWHPATAIISKLEEVANFLGFKVQKKNGIVKVEGSKEGRKGFVSIDTEIFELTPSFHLVEMKKTNGDALEYQKLWKENIRPALKDIVWAWQGEEGDLQQLKS